MEEPPLEKGSQRANKRGTENTKSPKRCDRQTKQSEETGLEKLSVSGRRLSPDYSCLWPVVPRSQGTFSEATVCLSHCKNKDVGKGIMWLSSELSEPEPDGKGKGEPEAEAEAEPQASHTCGVC